MVELAGEVLDHRAPGPAIGEEMAQRLGNGSFQSFSHLDHMAPFTHPDEMAAVVASATDNVGPA